MEFVRETEIYDLLRELNISRSQPEGERIYLRMKDDEEVSRLHLVPSADAAAAEVGIRTIVVPRERLADMVDHVIHKLHLHEVILLPVGKWRNVFDAVAFSLAEDEDWQEIDATATVELNTRDPLLCEPGDFHTVIALVKALLSDADSADQGLMLTSTAAPLLLEVAPESGVVRIALGSQALADEVLDVVEHA